MNVLIDNRIEKPFSDEYIELIDAVVKKTLMVCDADTRWEVSISIVNSDEIKQINSRYRNINRPTDVLSFPQYEQEDEFVYTATSPCLGDIIICMERAIEQASEYGHSVEREIGFLTAHGMLHLLGYDHKDGEENAMFNKQEYILNSLNLLR